ncbi:MAG: sulfate adenylyltransferase [Firmicutes bacterium]|nr:sulfate adenylyltransferase [Alicyclobacillaceae bacterium]MCL6498058.1 sulfate adenylyltransferase [Bacillota bacterium]
MTAQLPSRHFVPEAEQAETLARMQSWPRLRLFPASEQEARLLAFGAYHPLDGFMDAAQYRAVRDTARLPDGHLFPLPVVLPVPEAQGRALVRAAKVALWGAGGFRAILEPRELFWRDLRAEAQAVYGTADSAHPGVARLYQESPWCLAGRVIGVAVGTLPFPEPADPAQVRQALAERGWRTVAAFQTRNPPHRAHEYLHKVALEWVDGLLIHPLVGLTKDDDLPAAARLAAYRTALAHYYPAGRVLLAVFPAPMRYAGPREAGFHALVRRNYGATHIIIGRDHAGAGGFYPPDAAREWIVAHRDELGITPICFEAVGYCRRCQAMASQRTCPHGPEHWLLLSGTDLRHRLARGEPIPAEIMRPEVVESLRQALADATDTLSAPDA